MSKIREIFVIIIFGIINIIIAFAISSFLGISNTVIFRTFSTIHENITWEVIIFYIFSIVEAIIYEYLYCPN